MRFRRRLAELIAPPDDWASLPPLPPPEPRSGAIRERRPPRGWTAWLETLGRLPRLRRGALVDLAAGWLDGDTYARIEGYVPAEGVIVDLTPGSGLFGQFLAVRSPRRRIVGVTGDGSPNSAAPNLIRLEPAAPLGEGLPASAAILVLDSSPFERIDVAQALVTRCREALLTGGRLLVVARETRPRWRYAVGIVLDAIRFGMRRPLAASGRVVPADAWAAEMRRAGFRVQRVNLGERGLTPQVLIVGQSPASDGGRDGPSRHQARRWTMDDGRWE